MVKGLEVMQIVFSMKSRVEIMAIQSRYCMLELVFFKVLSHTDTVHVAEDASESGFIRYPGVADEIVAGSPQNSVYMYMYITFVHYACYEVMTSGSLDFSSHDMTAGYGYCSKSCTCICIPAAPASIVQGGKVSCANQHERSSR